MRLPPELEAKILAQATHVNGQPVERPGVVAIAAPARDCSEREFQAAVASAARDMGWLHYHTHDSRRSAPGFPDSIFGREWGKLRLFAAELKVPPGKPSDAQRRWLRILEAAGVPAFVWFPRDWPAILEVLRSE